MNIGWGPALDAEIEYRLRGAATDLRQVNFRREALARKREERARKAAARSARQPILRPRPAI